MRPKSRSRLDSRGAVEANFAWVFAAGCGIALIALLILLAGKAMDTKSGSMAYTEASTLKTLFFRLLASPGKAIEVGSLSSPLLVACDTLTIDQNQERMDPLILVSEQRQIAPFRAWTIQQPAYLPGLVYLFASQRTFAIISDPEFQSLAEQIKQRLPSDLIVSVPIPGTTTLRISSTQPAGDEVVYDPARSAIIIGGSVHYTTDTSLILAALTAPAEFARAAACYARREKEIASALGRRAEHLEALYSMRPDGAICLGIFHDAIALLKRPDKDAETREALKALDQEAQEASCANIY